MARKWKRRSAGKTNKGKHCIVYGYLRYGSRDEVLGVGYTKPACYRTARQAKSAYTTHIREANDEDIVAARFCSRDGACRPLKTPRLRKPLTAREKRRVAAAVKRASGDIPF